MVSPPLLDRFAADPSDPQKASPFFRLPREIRLMIYSQVWRSFGDCNNLHLHITEPQALACHSARSSMGMMAVPCWRPPPMEEAAGEDENEDAALDKVPCPPDTDDDPVIKESALPGLERGLYAMSMNSNGENADDDDDDADESDDYDIPQSADFVSNPEMNTRGVRLVCRLVRQKHLPWMTHAVCGHNYSRLQGWSFGADRKRRQLRRAAAAAAAIADSGDPSAPVGNVLPTSYYNRHPSLHRPFLPVLLTCKRMYVEAVQSLYESLTFQFTSTDTANDFLARWPCITSLHVLVDLPARLIDSYMPWLGFIDVSTPKGRLVREIGTYDRETTTKSSPWVKLCTNIVSLSRNTDPNSNTPKLRFLRVWLQTTDLRPWSNFAAETRLLADLLEARVAGGRPNFILCLPDLDEPDTESESESEPELQPCPLPSSFLKRRLLKGYYLGEDDGQGANQVDGDLPCTIKRGRRINKWQSYIPLLTQT